MRVRSKQIVVVSLVVWLLGCVAQGGDPGVSDSLPIESDWSFVRTSAGDVTMVIAPPRLGLAEPGLLVGAIERARRFVEAHPGVFAAAATPGALVLRDLRVDPRGGASVRFSLVVHGLAVDAMTGRILRDRPLARSEAARGSGIAVRGDRRELDIAVSGRRWERPAV